MKKLYLTVLAFAATCMLIWLQAEPNLFSYDQFMQWRSASFKVLVSHHCCC
ncbi:hypothetical protein JCM19238_4023 [Vibrio ponticus]|nr:hypothetical protein JCM19238_4023 [Vibrio ponticus]